MNLFCKALVALVCLLCVSRTFAFTSGINSVVSYLADYQSPGGGFHAYRDAEATLESTSHALFLSSLFGLRDKIKSDEAASFVHSLANPDHGFGNKLGSPSDVESVRNALLSFAHLGETITSAEKIATFINSLYDSESKLFAPTVGAAGDLKATALALQSLSSLNKLQSEEVKNKFDGIKKHLQTLKKSKEGTSFFSAITSDNYFAIVVGSFVGFDFGTGREWARYFHHRQVQNGPNTGSFYSDSEYSDATIEDAAFAINALYVLETTTGTDGLVDDIDTESLVDYITHLPRNLVAAAYAYVAVSRTSALQTLFKITPVYDVTDSKFKLVGNRIIQGTQVKLAISARTSYGLAHAGLAASVTIAHGTGEKLTKKLTWNSDSQLYTTDEVFDSNDKLGEVTFEYALRWRVADLGSDDLVLSHKDSKTVGYDLTVVSKAVHAGKEVEAGSDIGIGTEFTFEVKLGTTKQPKPTLLKGDFDVIFDAYDSSSVVIHQSKFDARSNSAAIVFKYTLTADNIPAGDVAFAFGVMNAKGVHTVVTVLYRLPVKMVASHINFKGFNAKDTPKYKIGESVSVEISPANLDLRTLHFFGTKDFAGKSVSRKLYMDVSAAETGVTLFSLMGTGSVSADNRPVYKFELPIDATFTAIGTHSISFHYRSATGQRFPLLNYDSANNDLFEDNSQLTYQVQAELHVADLKNGPKDGDLVYGDEVQFSFKVKDSITKKYVWGTQHQTVSLVLRSEGRNVTSNFQPATQQTGKDGAPETFSVSWSVNPNAAKGKGSIELIIQGTDGKEIQLLQEESQDAYKVNVNIGGKIDVSEKTYSTQFDEEETTFVAEAELTCNGKQLNGADLKATVKRDGKNGPERIVSLPVTYSAENGAYQVSWTMKNDAAVSGVYTVEFYRQVDRRHLVQQFPTATEAEIEGSVSPLFSVKISHTQQSKSALPIKTEFLVLSVLVVSFFWTSFKKMDIEGLRKTGKKKAN